MKKKECAICKKELVGKEKMFCHNCTTENFTTIKKAGRILLCAVPVALSLFGIKSVIKTNIK